MQAAAKKYPYMDISRVGIYGDWLAQMQWRLCCGTASFIRPPVSTAAVDNLDKVWWNEQWMDFP